MQFQPLPSIGACYHLPSCPGEAAQLAVGETKGMAMVKFEQHSDTATLFARILLSAVMWLYGYFKLTGYAGAVTYMS